MQSIRRVIAIIALVVIAIFSIQNFAAVDIDFLGWTVSVPKFVVIVVSYVCGMATGWGFFGFVKRSMKTTHSSKAEKSE